jgi:hypothetical protein
VAALVSFGHVYVGSVTLGYICGGWYIQGRVQGVGSSFTFRVYGMGWGYNKLEVEFTIHSTGLSISVRIHLRLQVLATRYIIP